MQLHELLRVARHVRGLTQRDLAAASGVGNAVIAQIEIGQIAEPSFAKVVRLCRALNLPIEEAASTIAQEPRDAEA